MAKKTSSLELFKAFLRELRGPEIKPVYAFFGGESFFPDRLQDAAIETIPEEARDFNLDVLYGLEVKVDKVISMCRSYPMMAERRAVIVRDFLKMFDHRQVEQGQGRNTSGDDEISLDAPAPGGGGAMDDLVAYLKQPNPTTLLLLTSEKRPAATTRLGNALKTGKFVTSHTFEPIPDFQLQQWIMEWSQVEHQVAFEENAAQLLAFHVGNNLQHLTVEIEKLVTYRKEDRPVSDHDVREVVGLSRDYTMFDFQDALFEGNREKSMMIAHQMLKKADSPAGEVIKIISFLYTSFGKIWLIQRLTRKGLPQRQIQEIAGIKSRFYFDKLARAGNIYALSTCPWLFEVLLDADKAIKGFSRQSPEAILLMTIKKITT